MSEFGDRLKAEMEYTGMLRKEVAFKSGVKKRALDMYLGTQGSIPPADVAVKIANVLNVSVEYLVTGKNKTTENQHYTNNEYRQMLSDFEKLPQEMQNTIKQIIHASAIVYS